MSTRAVYQDECVVGRQVPQRDRPDKGGAISDRVALRIDRRSDFRQAVGHIERCLIR